MGLFSNGIQLNSTEIPRHIKGVRCDVKNCVYHDGDGFCCADHINVGNIAALSSSDTHCKTFKARGDITKIR